MNRLHKEFNPMRAGNKKLIKSKGISHRTQRNSHEFFKRGNRRFDGLGRLQINYTLCLWTTLTGNFRALEVTLNLTSMNCRPFTPPPKPSVNLYLIATGLGQVSF